MDIDLTTLIDLIIWHYGAEGETYADRVALMNLDKVEEILENILSQLLTNAEGCDSLRKSVAEIGEKSYEIIKDVQTAIKQWEEE